MTNVTNTENVANNVVNEKVQHSNYGESATISHEPEVGDVYQSKDGTCFRITETNKTGYIGMLLSGDEIHFSGVFSPFKFLDDKTYLGKAKNPITSIFEVE